MVDIDLTAEEKKAIAALHRAAKIWPDSLWLYATGTLNVMRKKDGRHAMLPGFGAGVDPDYVVDAVDIENDGGDW